MKSKPNHPRESDLPRLSAPAQRALQSAGITKLEQLAKVSEAEILQLHGMGPNALNQLRQALAAKGLSFAEGKPSNCAKFLNAP